MRQLTALDAQFLAIETPRTWGHVSGLAVYDPSTTESGTLGIDDVCRLVSQRLHLLPPFRWRLAWVPFGLDHPYWIEDPDFDLDFHIRESAVPPPGDDRQLAEVISRIVARPLDRRRPLWELYLIHGLPDGRVAMLTKIHHAAVDGVSGAEILAVLLDLEPEGREIPPAPNRKPDRKPGQLEMLGRGLLGAPRQPLRAARLLPSLLPNVPYLPGATAVPGVPTVARAVSRARRAISGSRDGEILGLPQTTVPRTRFNARISPHRRFSFGSLELDRLKAIKNEFGVTLNDVVVALCAGALRSWLLERDELPDDPLVAMVPVSVRTREQMGTFGNRVSAMFAPIPTDEADPQARLMRAHEILRVAKERHRALPATLLQDATQFVPPAVLARAARVVTQLAAGAPGVRPALNLVISNVPGPRMPLYFGGAKLEAHYPVSVIADGVGLNITCLSYLDHVDFGIVVDRELVDDAWPLMDALREALDEFEQILGPTEPASVR